MRTTAPFSCTNKEGFDTIFYVMTNEPITGSRYEIKPATWRDLNILRELERVCFPLDAWPLLDLISVLTMPGVVRIKAEVGGEFAGFVAGDLRGPQNFAWIATVGVFPKYRGLGIGRALMEACEARLAGKMIRLCVRIDNHAAINLYETGGYRRVDIWSRYYTDGSDALIMEKDLTNLEPQPTSQL